MKKKPQQPAETVLPPIKQNGSLMDSEKVDRNKEGTNINISPWNSRLIPETEVDRNKEGTNINISPWNSRLIPETEVDRNKEGTNINISPWNSRLISGTGAPMEQTSSPSQVTDLDLTKGPVFLKELTMAILGWGSEVNHPSGTSNMKVFVGMGNESFLLTLWLRNDTADEFLMHLRLKEVFHLTNIKISPRFKFVKDPYPNIGHRDVELSITKFSKTKSVQKGISLLHSTEKDRAPGVPPFKLELKKISSLDRDIYNRAVFVKHDDGKSRITITDEEYLYDVLYQPATIDKDDKEFLLELQQGCHLLICAITSTMENDTKVLHIPSLACVTKLDGNTSKDYSLLPYNITNEQPPLKKRRSYFA